MTQPYNHHPDGSEISSGRHSSYITCLQAKPEKEFPHGHTCGEPHAALPVTVPELYAVFGPIKQLSMAISV